MPFFDGPPALHSGAISDEIVQFLVESYKTRHPGYSFDWERLILTLANNKVHTLRIQLLISNKFRQSGV